MIKVEKFETFGFEGAIRGMRNPLNSWDMSDSYWDYDAVGLVHHYVIGPKDLDLLLRLTKAGRSHRKVLRMMHVQMDVTAPLYWWKDYDTYKIATVANGCSTMHKIHAKEFTRDDFSIDMLEGPGLEVIDTTIEILNYYRNKFVESGLKDRSAWHSMIQLLPTSYMQKRTIDINYETALSLVMDREHHKLFEFRTFCVMLLEKMDYLMEIYKAEKGREEDGHM